MAKKKKTAGRMRFCPDHGGVFSVGVCAECNATPEGRALVRVMLAHDKLSETMEGDSNDDEHDAALDLVEALNAYYYQLRKEENPDATKA